MKVNSASSSPQPTEPSRVVPEHRIPLGPGNLPNLAVLALVLSAHVKIPLASPERIGTNHGEAVQLHLGEARARILPFARDDAMPIARGEQLHPLGGRQWARVEGLVRHAGGEDEDVAGPRMEFQRRGTPTPTPTMTTPPPTTSAAAAARASSSIRRARRRCHVVAGTALLLLGQEQGLGLVRGAEADGGLAREDGHGLVGGRVVVGVLGGAVPVDPLDLPAVVGEEVVDADGRVGVGGLAGEEARVVQEGKGGVWDEGGRGQAVLFDVDHGFSYRLLG